MKDLPGLKVEQFSSVIIIGTCDHVTIRTSTHAVDGVWKIFKSIIKMGCVKEKFKKIKLQTNLSRG